MILAVDKKLSAAKIHIKNIVLAADNRFHINKSVVGLLRPIIFFLIKLDNTKESIKLFAGSYAQ